METPRLTHPAARLQFRCNVDWTLRRITGSLPAIVYSELELGPIRLVLFDQLDIEQTINHHGSAIL
jgi:hypothetical protein